MQKIADNLDMLAALRSPILIEPTQCAVHAPERVIIAHLGAHVMLIHPFMNAEKLFRIREPGARRNRGSQLGQIAKIVSLGAVEVGGFDQRAASVLEGDRAIPQSRAAYSDDLIMRAPRNRELAPPPPPPPPRRAAPPRPTPAPLHH